jgi:hypothetical protein
MQASFKFSRRKPHPPHTPLLVQATGEGYLTTAAPVPTGIGLAYERFLELPVAVVLLVMWAAGAVLLGACALVAYAGVSALVGIVIGAF